ncbi:MAG TPA: DUF5916 domain-containing protein [Terriglobia bacterium]|nr:DUF5916 domain-containing protein [Terriglobia bacterium]
MNLLRQSPEPHAVRNAGQLWTLWILATGFGGLFLWPARACAAKDEGPPPPYIMIPRVHRPMTLEELVEGSMGERAVKLTGFVQRSPREGEPASQETTAYLAYDEKNLYIGFVCRDEEPELIRAHVTRRDNFWGDDHVGVTIDTYFDHRRAYAFSVNPLGIQEEALLNERTGDDRSFDTLWNSEGRLTPEGYVVLMAIPFKSLRFSPDEQQTWGITLSRSIPHADEYSTWPRISRSISGWLIQEAEARGLENITPGKNIQVNPYGFFTSRRYLNAETGQFERDRLDERLGLDAKWVLASNLTLDATVNPDFSQVESDQPQITVNRRFEVFFPERRPFFMENASYFDTPIEVLFTRRIVDPQFGAKLTGKVGPYTIAGLVADDRGPGEVVAPDDPSFGHRALFNVLRLSRDIHQESGVGMIWSDWEFREAYNRVFGVDGRWKYSRTTAIDFQALKSFSNSLEGIAKQGRALRVGLDHNGRHWNSYLGYNEKSPDFDVASGFIPRVDYRALGGYAGYSFRPEGRWIVSWRPYVGGSVVLDQRNVRQDYSTNPGFWVEFAQLTSAYGRYRYKRERYEGNDFLQRGYELGLRTRRSRWFSLGLSFASGDEINFEPPDGTEPFLGEGREVSFFMTVRPSTRLAVENTVLENRFLTLDQNQNIFNNNIFRSKWNYQFTPRLSLRVIGQYSNVLPDPWLSSLEYSKSLAGDVLLTYLLHPGTALYVGYSNLLENYDRQALSDAALLDRTRSGMLSTAAGAFVKFSYLYQF